MFSFLPAEQEVLKLDIGSPILKNSFVNKVQLTRVGANGVRKSSERKECKRKHRQL